MPSAKRAEEEEEGSSAMEDDQDEDADMSSGFLESVELMMKCLGILPHPQPGTAALLEPLLARDMSVLVSRAQQAAAARQSRSVSPEDVMLACSRDLRMMKRLLGYLEVRNFRAMNMPNARASSSSAECPLTSRCKQLIDESFRASVRAKFEDEEYLARYERLDRITQDMDPQEYERFSKLRGTSVQSRGECRRWIRAFFHKQLPSPTATALDMLGFVLKQLLAILVDLCLLVKAETAQAPSSPGGTGKATSASRKARLWDSDFSVGNVREMTRRLQAASSSTSSPLLFK